MGGTEADARAPPPAEKPRQGIGANNAINSAARTSPVIVPAVTILPAAPATMGVVVKTTTIADLAEEALDILITAGFQPESNLRSVTSSTGVQDFNIDSAICLRSAA